MDLPTMGNLAQKCSALMLGADRKLRVFVSKVMDIDSVQGPTSEMNKQGVSQKHRRRTLLYGFVGVIIREKEKCAFDIRALQL
jgi:hypothetical protein